MPTMARLCRELMLNILEAIANEKEEKWNSLDN